MQRQEAGGKRQEPPTREAVLDVLNLVPDPEVPALSVVELGIIRDVEIDGGAVTVVVTPTYSGCPAMHAIEHDVLEALGAHGIAGARIRTVYTPAWTTDWMSGAARDKLRAYGIAPPAGAERVSHAPLVTLGRRREPVACPFCGSVNTVLTSEFGATACKALHVCNECTQPFEEFKAI